MFVLFLELAEPCAALIPVTVSNREDERREVRSRYNIFWQRDPH
jgi:hypothetical protein